MHLLVLLRIELLLEGEKEGECVRKREVEDVNLVGDG